MNSITYLKICEEMERIWQCDEAICIQNELLQLPTSVTKKKKLNDHIK